MIFEVRPENRYGKCTPRPKNLRRQIFTNIRIQHTSLKKARKWLAGLNMTYWPQQLHFALRCVSTDCGISRDILLESSLNLTRQIRSFYLFHVYFTTRHILFEVGGIQSISALPRQTTATLHHTKGVVQNLELIRALIFVSKKEQTTDLVRCLSKFPLPALCSSN